MSEVEARPDTIARIREHAASRVFGGPGEVRALARALDWAATPLGPVERWPASLRTAAGLVVGAVVPMVLLWGPELVQVYNDAYAPFLGARHPWGLGRRAREVRPETWQTDTALYARVRAGESVAVEKVRFPATRRVPDGPAVDLDVTLAHGPVHDDEGAVAGVLVTIQHATERAASDRAEAKLRDREERYRALFESMDEAYAVVEVIADEAGAWRDLRFLEVNPAFVARTGMPYPVGLTATELLGPTDPGWAERYGRVAESGEPVRFEETEFTLGRVFDLNVFRLGGPGSRHVAVLFTDVTERKHIEAALRASEERFRRAIEEAPIPVIMQAEDGEVLHVSRTWTELTGYTFADVSTLDAWLTRAYGPGADTVRDHVHALFGGRRRAIDVEFRVRTRDGELRHWSFSASSPGTLRDGRRFIVGMASDVTDRYRAADAAARVLAHTDREALRRALAAAEEAERRRLARELHDHLGQQLTAFALGTDDALRLAATGDGASPASGAPPDATPLMRRLAELHALARQMQAGARYLTLELRPPELDDVGLESALATYVSEWGARYGIAAEVAVTGPAAAQPLPDEVASALFRIVQEALTNVAKHAGATQVSVIAEKADGEVRLIVEDDGCGFDVAATTARARRERRLGLSSMRERAALIDGTLDMESIPGGGTTLYVHVPLEPRAGTGAPSSEGARDGVGERASDEAPR